MRVKMWINELLVKQNTWNIVFLILFFPVYLYIIQSSQKFFSIFGIAGFLILLGYLFWLYRYKIRFYQIPLHFIIASILFMQVIKGETVPLALIVSVLGISLFFVQDIISNEEYKISEIMRQVVLSGIIFMSFITFAFLFGIVFISSNSISEFVLILLSIIVFISSFNIITYTLWMYNIDKKYYIPVAVIASLIIVQLFIGLRILPFTHLTQSMILTTYLIFSISIFRDIYLKKIYFLSVILRIVLLIFLLSLLIFTSLS
jgi:hypothetical protein